MANDELEHHGILGQKWGVRRYQNPDGTLTSAGKVRYNTGKSESKSKGLTDKQKDTLKKVAIGVGVAAAAGLAVYGAYKYSEAIKTEAWNQTIRKGEAALKEANNNTKFWEEAAEQYAGMSKEQIKAGHDAVNSLGIESINKTAEYNSSTFRQAKRTLKGEGRRSIPELDAASAHTFTPTRSDGKIGRTDWESRLKKQLTDKGYGYEDYTHKSPDGSVRSSKSIFSTKNQNGSDTPKTTKSGTVPKLTLNPDTKSSEIGSKKAAEVLNTLKDLAADSSNASKKATDAWQEGEQYTKKLLSKM